MVVGGRRYWFDAEELFIDGLSFMTPHSFLACFDDLKDRFQIGSSLIVKFSNG